jgi:dipicolinate synthase subunit A
VRFSIIEGDARNARLCKILTEEGRGARLFSQSDAALAADFGDIIVLPVKGIPGDMFVGLLNSRHTLVTGGDFLRREDFLILNAVPSAEGAVGLAMREMPVTIHGSEMLVLGFGRLGKLLCKSLLGLGASVTASARNNADFAWIETLGCRPAHTSNLSGILGKYDAVINTIPHMVLSSELLREIKQSCVIIDLASEPGGTDFGAARQMGLNCHWALGLPGKCSPESAARIMRQVLEHILAEKGVKL